MSIKDDYFARMVSQLKRWDAEFGMLDGRTGQLSETARARYDEQLKAVYVNRDAARRALQEIRTAGESGWRGKQSAMDDAWAALKGSLDHVTAWLRKAA